MSWLWNSIVTLFCYIFALFFGIGRVGDTGNFHNNNWMKDLPDSAYVSEISMPGTHNSCAFYEPVYNVAAVQEYSVTDQLNMGVRYLDIRCAMGIGHLKIVHSIVDEMDTFDSVMDKVVSFLKANPTETVIVAVKQDVHIDDLTRDDFSSEVKEVLDDNPDYYFTENRIPTLGEARGKIILINRFDEAFSYGLNTDRWTSGTGLKEYSTFSLLVQDNSYVESYDVKWNDIVEYIDKANALTTEERQKILCLNHFNGNEYYGKQRTVAADMNQRFLKYVEDGNLTGKFTGVLIFDMVNEQLCNAVINNNY